MFGMLNHGHSLRARGLKSNGREARDPKEATEPLRPPHPAASGVTRP
jgi:hypothetical protein